MYSPKIEEKKKKKINLGTSRFVSILWSTFFCLHSPLPFAAPFLNVSVHCFRGIITMFCIPYIVHLVIKFLSFLFTGFIKCKKRPAVCCIESSSKISSITKEEDCYHAQQIDERPHKKICLTPSKNN